MKIEELPIPEGVKTVITSSGITELYPPQEDAIHAGALEGENLVLASPTASGKTLIAELCALKHVLEHNGKVLYLTPLRALANEKFNEFKKYSTLKKNDGTRVSVGISTGDYDRINPWLGKHDVIITTNEKTDSLLRHRSRWMDQISLVVVDEVHLLNDAERGPTLEVVLARLIQINPHAQILTLSATVKNAEEAAEWLKARSVTTNWRPITLREGVLLGDEVTFRDGSSSQIDKQTRNPTINLVLHVLNQGGQALIFVNTRKSTISMAKRASNLVKDVLSPPVKRSLRRVADRILSTGERTRISELLAELIVQGIAFHHAGLTSAHRNLIESSFRERKIKAIVATPTLAFGVNLPARVVVINDYRRYEPGYGYYPIAVLEYKQMAGRAGRPHYDHVGEALLIAKTRDERDYLIESYIKAEPERIWSKLAVERVLRSHVLATIAADFAQTEQSVFDFFSKTFYAHQYDPYAIKEVIKKILGFLYQEKMIRRKSGNIFPTKFGRRVSELYIDPLSSVTIREALANRPLLLSNLSFFHMISHTLDMYPKLRPYSREINNLALFADEHQNEFMLDIPIELTDRITYEAFLGEVKLSWVLNTWVEEASEDEIINKFQVQPGDLYRLIETSYWLLHASHELAVLLGHKDLLSHLTELMERTKRGVKKELLPLVRLEGIGRVRARILFDSGLKTLEDLKKAPFATITNLPLMGPNITKRVKEQVGGLIKSRDWDELRKQTSREQKSLTEY